VGQKLDIATKIQGVVAEKLFPLYLTSSAFAVSLGIPEEGKADYEMVSWTLSSAFSPEPFRTREEFISRRLNNDESVGIYCADLTRLAKAVNVNADKVLLECAHSSRGCLSPSKCSSWPAA